jgi:glycerol-3-phosphate dehydrogenase (NAD(P)+)
VLGAGSWGTALAAQLARNGVPTTLWGRTPQAVVEMATLRRNARYLPELALPEALQLSAMLEPTVRDAGIVLLAVPSHAFGALLDEVAPWIAGDAGVAWATKGFDPGTGRFLHQLVAERLPGHPAAVITGPSFAHEVALGRGVPLADAVAAIGQVVESVQTVDTVMQLAREHGVELPISALVQRVLHEELTPAEGMRELLAREQKPEYPEPA